MSEQPVEASQYADTSSKEALLPREMQEKYQVAARIGSRVLSITTDMAGFSFSPDEAMFNSDFVRAVSKPTQEVLTEEDVVRAQEGSFGLSLEVARQFKKGEIIRRGRIDDNLETIEGLYETLSMGQALGEELAAQGAERFLLIVKEVSARAAGIKLEESQMTEAEAKKWADGNFRIAKQRIGQKIEVLRGYLGF